jgi:hypothetical protein
MRILLVVFSLFVSVGTAQAQSEACKKAISSHQSDHKYFIAALRSWIITCFVPPDLADSRTKDPIGEADRLNKALRESDRLAEALTKDPLGELDRGNQRLRKSYVAVYRLCGPNAVKSLPQKAPDDREFRKHLKTVAGKCAAEAELKKKR